MRLLGYSMFLLGWRRIGCLCLIGLYGSFAPPYVFPIRPHARHYLTGTYGELREGHFHTGIDIPTGGQENWPVYAIEEGFISRIQIEPHTYGRTLYLTHPDGRHSLYAHLNAFRADIETYVIEAQYQLQRYAVDLYPPKQQFQVARGGFIARSGNTGRSSGPHLHFEILNKNGQTLNPLDFEYEGHPLTDYHKPRPVALRLCPQTITARINGQWHAVELPLVQRYDGTYGVTQPLNLSGWIGFELRAYDPIGRRSYSSGTVPQIQVWIDHKKALKQHINALFPTQQTYFSQHIAYDAYLNKGRLYHRMYRTKGNKLPFYQFFSPHQDIGFLFDSKMHRIRIQLSDQAGHSANVHLRVNIPNAPMPYTPRRPLADVQHKVIGHVLKLLAPPMLNEPVCLVFPTHSQYVLPAYQTHLETVYLWNLKDGIPVQSQWNTLPELHHFSVVAKVAHARRQTVVHDGIQLSFESTTLYDTLYLTLNRTTYQGLECVEVGPMVTPLRGKGVLGVRPSQLYPPRHTSMYRASKNKWIWMPTEWRGSYAYGEIDALGRFALMEDHTPPHMQILNMTPQAIELRVQDELSGISHWKAKWKGQWLLMAYQPMAKRLEARLKNEKTFSNGLFEIEVYDKQGNFCKFSQMIH